jgi:uncharacterized protein (DUF433 family)
MGDQVLYDRIVVSRDIAHGKPRIANTRIMVYQVLDLLAAVPRSDYLTRYFFARACNCAMQVSGGLVMPG